MKIALVNKFFFLNGGQETVALEQMKLLQEASCDVAFYAMHHPKNPLNYEWSPYFSDYADFSLRGNPQPLKKKLQLAGDFIVNRTVAKRFRGFLEAFQPDIIHCHGIAHQLTYSILPEAKKLNIPVVQTLHDYQAVCPSYTLLKGVNQLCESGCSTNNYIPCIQHRCVKESFASSVLSALEMFYNRSWFDYTVYIDTFISPSHFLAERIIQSGISPNRVRTIPNFMVDIETITPSISNEGYFLYVGRLSHEKGLMTLLDAFRQTPDAVLHIAGEGSMRDTIKTYCQTHDLKNIHLLGYLDREQTKVAISKATAVILPSEWYENQPMCIIEAFAYGKPVIASKIGGIPEMVIDNENGLLFSPGDAEALAAAVKSLIGNKEKCSVLGQKARQDAVSCYNPQKHIDSLFHLYKNLI